MKIIMKPPLLLTLKLTAAALAAFGPLAIAQAGTFSSDFNSGAPTGLTLYGTAAVGEEGAGTGYTIEFDTFGNGAPDTAPGIDVKVGSGFGDHSASGSGPGPEFAQAVVGGLTPSPEAFVDCVIQLNPNNTLTV